jgi:hypothetical protein
MAGTPIHNTLLAPMEGQGGTGDPNEVNPPKAEIPIIGQPQDVVSFDSTIRTNDKGAASLTIKAKPPYMPRGYLDGQIYFIKYMLELPPGVPANVQQHALDVIAIHVRDAYAIPEQPTWEADILPIFQQFGNLYPIMSKRMIDLASYEDVVKHRDIIDLAFSLDISNPNYMPVTRDLSPAKQKTILNWLRRKALDGTYLLERGSRQGPPSGALVPQPMSPADEATASSPEAVAQSKLFRRLALLKGGKTDR